MPIVGLLTIQLWKLLLLHILLLLARMTIPPRTLTLHLMLLLLRNRMLLLQVLLWLISMLLRWVAVLMLLLLLLLRYYLLVGIEIGIVPTLIKVLMSYVHGRGLRIPMTLIGSLMHESRISSLRTNLHSHALAMVLLLAGIDAVGIRSAHLSNLLLLLMMLGNVATRG